MGNEKIIIYGAGKWAQRLLVLFRINNMANSVVGFAVSDLDDNYLEWDGYQIHQYDFYREILSKCIIYIAIKGKSADDVYQRISNDKVLEIKRLDENWFLESNAIMKKHFASFPVNRKKVFFYCNDSRGFRCNCKYIALGLLDEKKEIEILWDVSVQGRDELIEGVKPVLRNTYDYYYEVYTSGVIISNEGVDNTVEKRPEQFYMMTWHGAGPFKKVGVDVPDYDKEIKERIVKEFAKYDVCISCSDALDYEYRHAFGYKGEVLHTGYPRNDIFFRADTHIKNKIYELFGLDKNKGIILYAPTFRNIREKSVSRYDLDLDKIIQAAENRFGMRYQVVYRFHYNLSDVYSDSQLFSRGVNATSYPDMQELLLAADILLTDYSSSMWDFSLQRKPVFLYHSDLDLYMSDRGFYSRPDEWPYPSGRSTEELCREITTFDSELYRMKVDEFFEKYGSYDDGHATERVVDRVLDVMRLPDKYGKA